MKIQAGTQSQVEVNTDRPDRVSLTVKRYDALLEIERKYDLRKDQADIETISAERYANLLEVERKYTEWQASRLDDWDEAQHARDAAGRFASDATAETLVAKAKSDGGFTHHPTKGTPTSGYIVSSDTKEKRGKIVDLTDSNVDVKKEVSAYLQKNEGHLGPNEYIGGYVQKSDPKDGEKEGKAVALHLDISNHFSDKDEAIRLGRKRNQISVWDVKNGKEILTGGTGREPSPEKPDPAQTKMSAEEIRTAQEDADYEQLADLAGKQAYKTRNNLYRRITNEFHSCTIHAIGAMSVQSAFEEQKCQR